MKITFEHMQARARELTTEAKDLVAFGENIIETAAIASARASLAWGHVKRMHAKRDGRALIEKAVREEREATVRYLRRVESDDRWIDGSAVIPRIERGMHRK